MITAITIAKMRFFMFSPSNSVKYLLGKSRNRTLPPKNQPLWRTTGAEIRVASEAAVCRRGIADFEKCLVLAHRCWSDYTISNILCKALLLM
jgi:hypothetical protein